MNKHFASMLATAAVAFTFSAHAADTADGISRAEAKDLKTQSEAQYKARKKVAEAKEDLNKADCKTALDGSAKRACEKTAKNMAKTDKSAAKTVHEAEEKSIKDSKK